MVMLYSGGVREHVIEAVEADMSRREAADAATHWFAYSHYQRGQRYHFQYDLGLF